MKLFGSLRSPYVRKVRIVLAEKGLACDFVETAPNAPGSPVPGLNPLGKVPVLVTGDGVPIFDSPVIAEYADGIGTGPMLIPTAFADRIAVRRLEALGDGMADIGVDLWHELREPTKGADQAVWRARQVDRLGRCFALLQTAIGPRSFVHGEALTLADIAVGIALGYLRRAAPDIALRPGFPSVAALAERLEARPSFIATRPAEQPAPVAAAAR